MPDQQTFVYRYEGGDPLGPPSPDMEVCAKVYRGAHDAGPGIDRVTLAAVVADRDAMGEAFLAAAAGLNKMGKVPPEVAAGVKIASDWVMAALAGTPAPVVAVQ